MDSLNTYKWLDAQEVKPISRDHQKANGIEAYFQKRMASKMLEILNQL